MHASEKKNEKRFNLSSDKAHENFYLDPFWQISIIFWILVIAIAFKIF